MSISVTSPFSPDTLARVALADHSQDDPGHDFLLAAIDSPALSEDPDLQDAWCAMMVHRAGTADSKSFADLFAKFVLLPLSDDMLLRLWAHFGDTAHPRGLPAAAILQRAELPPQILEQACYHRLEWVRRRAARHPLCPPEARVAAALLRPTA